MVLGRHSFIEVRRFHQCNYEDSNCYTPEITRGYYGLLEVSRDYSRLLEITRGCYGLLEVSRDY